MRFLVLLALVSDPPSFEQLFESRLLAKQPAVTVVSREPLLVVVRTPGGHDFRIGLETLAQYCGDNPARCSSAMDHLVYRAAGMIEAWEEEHAKERIVAVPVVGDAGVTVRAELDGKSLEDKDLKRLHLASADLEPLALRNTDSAHKTLLAKPFTPGSRVLVVHEPDAAGILFVPRLVQQARKQVKGRLLMAAPSRDTLIFTGGANLGNVATLMGAARDLAAHEAHPISPTVLEWSDDGWRPARKLP